MTSCSSVASTSYACAYRSSCRCCSRCCRLSSSYLFCPLVSLKIVRWWEGRQLPRTRRGSCLKTVPAYGFRSQAGFTLQGTPQPDYRESAPVPASADSRCNRPSVPEVVNTTQMMAYSARTMQAPDCYDCCPQALRRRGFGPNESGCDSKQKPARH